MEDGLPLENANYLRTIYVLSSVARKTLLWIFKNEFPDKLDIETFDAYLKRKSWVQRPGKPLFDSTQQKIVANDRSCASFDITILALIFRKVQLPERVNNPTLKNEYDHAWKDENAPEGMIKRVKNMRNDVFHGPIMLTVEEMTNYISTCKNIVVDLSKSIGKLYQISDQMVQIFIDELEEDMNKAKCTPISINQLRETMEELFKQMIRDGVEELFENYDQWTRISPVFFLDGFTCEIKVESIFVEMIAEECGRSITKDSIIDCADVLASDKHNIVLIEGAGKSTFMKYILANWTTKCHESIKNLSNFQIVVYFECRNHSVDSLTGLLTLLLSHTVKKFNCIDPLKCILDLNVLFLVDGLDELNDSSHKVFREILDVTCKPNVALMCTSRSSYIPTFYKTIPARAKARHIRLEGIPNKRSGKFVRKLYNHLCEAFDINEEVLPHESHIDFLISLLRTSSPDMQIHFQLPLNLTLVTTLWAIDPETVHNVTTVTELYSSMLLLVTEKLCERLVKKSKHGNMSAESLKRAIELSYEELCSYSLEDFKMKAFILTKNHINRIKQFCSAIHCDGDIFNISADEVITAFLSVKHTWSKFSSVVQYSYPHRSFQEFMAAKEACKRMLEDETSIKSLFSYLEAGFPEHIDGVNSPLTKRYNNQLDIFLHIIGIFYEHHQEQLKRVGCILANYIAEFFEPNFEWWIKFLRESKNDIDIAEAVSKHLTDIKWVIKENSAITTTVLLQFKVPVKFDVEFQNYVNLSDILDMMKHLHKPKILDMCSGEKIILNYENNHNFLNPVTRGDDIIISSIMMGRAELCRFCGHITEPNTILKLPSSIKSLFISISSAECLDALFAWPHFSKLNFLSLQLQKKIPISSRLPMPNLPQIILSFLNAVDSHVDWIVQAMLLLQPKNGFQHVTMQGSPLYFPKTGLVDDGGDGFTEIGAKQFVEALGKAVEGLLSIPGETGTMQKNIVLKLPLFMTAYSSKIGEGNKVTISSELQNEQLSLILAFDPESKSPIFPRENRSKLLRTNF